MESIYDNLPRIKGSGEILKDGSNDWVTNKLKSIAVSKGFKNDNKYWLGRSQRMFECGSYLTFSHNNHGERRLITANFCKDRMCPACQKRRSLVVFHQVKNVCKAIAKDNPTYKYLLLTLTVPNVCIDELGDKISDMAKAWGRLTKRVEFKKGVKGWFRTLEVTTNHDRGDYHPHYHVLLCVQSNYFAKNYIKQERWLELWQESMRDDSITQVDVRRVKPNPKKTGSDAVSSGAAEVAKYATKPSDYILKIPSKERYIAVEKTVQDLAKGIAKRKLVAFGGIMLEYSKLLDLKDVDCDSIDLVNTDGDSDQIDAVATQIFKWNIGFNNYIC
jgi:plasmid rolling circle replication initiator protein Rep